MLIIFLILSLGLIALGFFSAYKHKTHYNRWDYDNGGTIGCWIPGIIGLVAIIVVVIVLIINLVNCKVIEQKIEVLTENNNQIEEKLYITLQAYCEHENKTLIEISPDNPEVILLVYPELKADQLFESYILTLKSNNTEIRNLKIKKINESIYKWWLYFGG